MPEYWVIDLQHEVTVVHTAPRRGKYTKLRRVPWRKQLVSSAVAGLSMKLSELL